MMKYLKFCIFGWFMLAGCTTAIQNMTRADNNITCTLHDECPEYLGDRSFCSEGVCQCNDHHHTNNTGICIKDRGLGETCDTDDQCYWGPQMVDKIECSLGVCACRYGYVKHKGRICVRYYGNGAANIYSSGLSITVIGISLVATFY